MWISKRKWHDLCNQVEILEQRLSNPRTDLRLYEKIHALYDYLNITEVSEPRSFKLVSKSEK